MFKLVAGTLAALLMAAPGDGDPDGGKKKERKHHPPGVTLAIKDIDTDGDGRISKDEFMAYFQKLDRNQDGFLSSEELSSSGHGAKNGEQKKSKHEKKSRNGRKQ